MAQQQANARIEFFTLPFECRLVWPYLSVKRTIGPNKEQLTPDKQYYEAPLVIPKTAATAQQCQNYAFLAGKLMSIIAQQPGWNGQWPQNGDWPIKDGDAAPLNKYPWAHGQWVISPWSNNLIRAFDMGNNELSKDLAGGDYRGLKGGDYVLASINAFAYDNLRKGISFGIEGVKKTRDGDPIGSGERSVEQMFGAPTGAPVQYLDATGAPPIPGGAPQQQPDPQAPFTQAPGGGYPTPGGAPSHYAPSAAPMLPMAPAPNPAYAPQPSASGHGAYPSSVPQPAPYAPAPGYAPQPAPYAPAPGYAPQPGQPVAPPQYAGGAPGPTYTPPPIGTR